MQIAPHPGLHAAHRGAEHEAQPVHAEALGEQRVLGVNHVGVGVARESGPQAVAGLAGAAVADAVGHDQEVAAGVEQLARPEEHICELRAQEGLPAPAGAVEQQHRIGRPAGPVALQRAQRGVAQPQLRQHAALNKVGIGDHKLACDRHRRRCNA